MSKKIEEHLLYIFFVAFTFLQVFIMLFGKSEYGYGGADNIAHYQIAKYAFKYPELFLDLWGKPVYTALLAPFAQLGYKIANSFNILAAVVTMLLSVKITNRIFPGKALFSVVLIAFAPVYFFLSVSCLTEVLFSLFLLTAVYFVVEKRFDLSAIILSFLPFIRSEGVIILPVFAIAFLLQRSYRSILFLAVGSLFYSLIGYFVFGDFLWIITQQPYSMGESIYGSGELFHFVKKSNFIFGIPLLVLICFGLVYWTFELIKKRNFRSDNAILFITIVGSWILYFAAHSYVWWKGTGGSLGLTRVIGGVIPLAVLTGMKTADFLSSRIKKPSIVYGVFSFLTALQIVLLFTQNKIMSSTDTTEELIKKSADYICFNEEGKKVFYFNPMVIHFLDYDPYDTKQCNWGVGDKIQPSNSMNWGDILVWDAHFGANEGGIQLEVLENDRFLKKEKSFYPVEKVIVLGGYDYSVHIFKKAASKNYPALANEQFEKTLNFESYEQAQVHLIDDRKVWKLDASQEYSPSITVTPDVIKRYELLNIKASVNYKSLEYLDNDKVLLIISVDNKGKNLRYEKMALISSDYSWNEVEIEAKMPANIPETSTIKIYVWNKDKKNILIDHISLNIESR